MSEYKRGNPIMTGPSNLQVRLANQILSYIRSNHIPPARHLAEPTLCEHFKVSRTPVRAALALLREQGYVEHLPRRGYFTTESTAVTSAALPESDEDKLYLTIAEDRITRRLPSQISEAELARRYSAQKGVLTHVLQRLLREGLVERRPGRGWTFAPVLDSKQTHDESYRFRLALEPVALLEPGFRLDRRAAERSEAKHRRIVTGEVTSVSPIELFEMNAEFHEMLAASSGNRFFLEAIRQQNRLRRFVNYHWTYGAERVVGTCREHLSVLEAIKSGDLVWASTLMRRHLEIASSVSPYEKGNGSAAHSVPERLIHLPQASSGGSGGGQ